MRPVDAEALEKKISEWLGQPGNGDYYSGYDAALCAVQDLIADTPTITQPNEPLTLGLVDKYGAPLYAGDTVAADKFFMYAIRYGSHNVNPKQCEPAYQVGWYLEIVWALYNEDKTYIGHTEALYDIGGVAARYPAHCADTTEGVQNLLLYKHRPPEVSP